MNEIINKINEELSINFKVDNSYLDDNLDYCYRMISV